MKLDIKGNSIMLLALLVLLAGCKQKSGLEILSSRMEGLKALRSQYVVHQEGEKDVAVSLIYVKPNRILFSSDDFVVGLNEIDGHFESIFSEKVYDALPFDGKLYPGTGKVVDHLPLQAGPAAANPPLRISPETPWKLETKKGNIERYTKTVKGMNGPETFKLEVTDKGEPVQFIVPNDISYVVKSFELTDDIPLEKFRVAPKDGFVGHRITPDLVMLDTGRTFSWSMFKAANDVGSFKLEGNTLFAFVDPQEPTSMNSMNWIKASGKGYRKITISKGTAASGFYDPSGKEIDKLTSTTPLFVLVNKDSKIIGMWQGFDPTKTAELEKDIQEVLSKGR